MKLSTGAVLGVNALDGLYLDQAGGRAALECLNCLLCLPDCLCACVPI